MIKWGFVQDLHYHYFNSNKFDNPREFELVKWSWSQAGVVDDGLPVTFDALRSLVPGFRFSVLAPTLDAKVMNSEMDELEFSPMNGFSVVMVTPFDTFDTLEVTGIDDISGSDKSLSDERKFSWLLLLFDVAEVPFDTSATVTW